MDLPEVEKTEKDAMRLDDTDRMIEAIIAAADKSVDTDILIGVIRDNRYNNGRIRKTGLEADLKNTILKINNIYQYSGNAFRIEKLASGYRMMTLPEFEHPIRKYLHPIRQQRLSKPALETLAVIAYRQPVVKSEVERIRGVAVDGVIRTLLDRKLVKITGRSNGPGKPLLYSTTKLFLEYFGMESISDLPGEKEIEMLIGEQKAPRPANLILKREQESAEDYEDEEVVNRVSMHIGGNPGKTAEYNQGEAETGTAEIEPDTSTDL